MIYLKNIVENPTFYLWSNDLENIDMSLFNTKVHKIYHDSKFTSDIDKRALDLFLISQCNHHIVIPSSFNWWGAWLCQKNNKIICRPNDNFFLLLESTMKIFGQKIGLKYHDFNRNR